MPVDLATQTGFNDFWEGVVGTFRRVAVDDPMNGGNLDGVTTHLKGAVDQDTLLNQHAYPVVWSVPLNHSPNYATVDSDQGTLSMRVVVLAADVDPETAFRKSRTLAGRIVNNVEGTALVDQNGDAQASNVELQDFQMDSRPLTSKGAQVKFAEVQFSIDVERRY